jgi:hypothetical protein
VGGPGNGQWPDSDKHSGGVNNRQRAAAIGQVRSCWDASELAACVIEDRRLAAALGERGVDSAQRRADEHWAASGGWQTRRMGGGHQWRVGERRMSMKCETIKGEMIKGEMMKGERMEGERAVCGANPADVEHIPYNHIGRRTKKCVRVCAKRFHVTLFDKQEYLCFVVASHPADAPRRCGALGSPREPRYETYVHT